MSDHSNTSQNTYTFPNRVKNPIRVARAVWRVTKDLSRTEDAAIVQIAFAQLPLHREGARGCRLDTSTGRDEPRSWKAA
jgi:hypothetical protein